MDLLTRTSGYTLLIADDATQVEAAQRLRYDVFAGELGATLHTSAPGRDVDEFDAACDHLVVRDDATGAVVGPATTAGRAACSSTTSGWACSAGPPG